MDVDQTMCESLATALNTLSVVPYPVSYFKCSTYTSANATVCASTFDTNSASGFVAAMDQAYTQIFTTLNSGCYLGPGNVQIKDTLAIRSPCANKAYSPACPTDNSEFPFCKCGRQNLPYEVTLNSEVKQLPLGYNKTLLNTYCFTVKTSDCSGPCCEADFDKFDIQTPYTNCNGSVRQLTVDGKVQSYIWEKNVDSKGDTWAVFKANRIKWSKSQAEGKEICVTLWGRCPSLTDFAWQGTTTGVKYAIFNTGESCCGVERTLPISTDVYSRRR